MSGRALQQHELQVRVVGHRAADELDFEVRLAVEEEDLFLAVLHVDQHLAHVVLRDLLALLIRNAEPNRPRARLRWP